MRGYDLPCTYIFISIEFKKNEKIPFSESQNIGLKDMLLDP